MISLTHGGWHAAVCPSPVLANTPQSLCACIYLRFTCWASPLNLVLSFTQLFQSRISADQLSAFSCSPLSNSSEAPHVIPKLIFGSVRTLVFFLLKIYWPKLGLFLSNKIFSDKFTFWIFRFGSTPKDGMTLFPFVFLNRLYWVK